MKLMRFLKNHDPFIRATTRASLLFKTRNADVQDRGDDQLRKTGLEIMRKLHRHAEERHRGFAIVLLPIWEEMFVPQSASAYEGTRRMLEKFCKDEQMAFCDLKDPFVKKYGVEGSAPLFDRRSRHYSAAGYREMAERINGWLAEIEPRYPSPVSQVLNGDKP
ncbi:SGNH/GDSL hydrolase family protein [Candidatus Sumerlaeota bacterium]|nr:SGNH/GDSL hydrolase family protein [Candidatus Sumerlaeota bacterium]